MDCNLGPYTKAIIHIHAVTEECEVIKIVHEIDGKTRQPKVGSVLVAVQAEPNPPELKALGFSS